MTQRTPTFWVGDLEHRRSSLSAAVLLGSVACVPPLAAHPLAPAYLALEEQSEHAIAVHWRTSLWSHPDLAPVLPADCLPTNERHSEHDSVAQTTTWSVACTRPLAGREVSIAGLDAANTTAVVRLELRDKRVVHAVLDGGRPSLRIPERAASGSSSGRDFATLGAVHLVTGLDHLLFVVGLFLLAGNLWTLFATITAFTIGHALTLALSVLGFARIPSAPIEVLIALTIVVLATELARSRVRSDARESMLRRRPVAMAWAFGLLHGLGFAGALREVGLPESDVPLALAAFHLGIEAAQLAFVALLLAGRWIVRAVQIPLPASAQRTAAYAMGIMAGYWTWDRAAALW